MKKHQEVCQRAFAKTNLILDIGPKGENGYHVLTSVMQTIALWDEVTVSLCMPGDLKEKIGPEGIYLECNWARMPRDERNLAYQAALLFIKETGVHLGEDVLKIRLYKKIPSSAGLGGGSADAASTLKALNHLFFAEGLIPEEVPFTKLLEMAARLGSDVPYCMIGGTCLVSGCGEKVERIAPYPASYVVMVKPDFGISTADAYTLLDDLRKQGSPRIEKHARIDFDLMKNYRYNEWKSLTDRFYNDLEAPAFEMHKILKHIRWDFLQNGARKALLCGSGSTVMGLFDDEETAKTAFSFMKKYYGSRYFVSMRELYFPGRMKAKERLFAPRPSKED